MTPSISIVIPVYNEDPERVFTALSRMGLALRREGVARHFDIFVLSDTRKDNIADAEMDAFAWLKRQLSPAVRVYYRRRENNHHRKAGNIADFVQRPEFRKCSGMTDSYEYSPGAWGRVFGDVRYVFGRSVQGYSF